MPNANRKYGCKFVLIERPHYSLTRREFKFVLIARRQNLTVNPTGPIGQGYRFF